ncbi:type II secretion system protein [Adhaeretor mobilis]|uniref:Type II secretion system protein n=1 Tax=Adhaeretor mobilis TaxID=1930276 RepID=A0A517MT14_9BACT|nr:prepilin-type N-terminal cleavage/methylation domain-containing protein [Adhaeretor mobilis]QDS98025.1 hypothetical protein HG15A2_12950 [Adhaeretor mobilis]
MIIQGGRWKAKGGGVAVRARSNRGFPLPPSPLRPAVTLIELMITMAIISILAAALLGASNAAFESARHARTKSIITKIDGLLMERYQSYTTRRVNVQYVGGPYSGRDQASARLLAIRSLMKLEMPDRWSDILGPSSSFGATVQSTPPGSAVAPVTKSYPLPLQSGGFGMFSTDYPAITSTYLRRYNSLNSSDLDAVVQNQGAECLFMVIMYATGEGEARTLFSEQDIADTDGDGAPEFIDGWGQPISWLRWPTGYAERSTVMTSLNNSMFSLPTQDAEAKAHRADVDHDPFDPFRRDRVVSSPQNYLQDENPAFRLVPLIYSSGADGESGINSKTDDYIASLDPYEPGSGTFVGTPDGDVFIDNITNHDGDD